MHEQQSFITRELPVTPDYDGKAYELSGPAIDQIKNDLGTVAVAYVGKDLWCTSIEVATYDPDSEFYRKQTETGFVTFYEDGNPANGNMLHLQPPIEQDKYETALRGFIGQLVVLEQKI